MAKVFISHSWKDNDIAKKIAYELKHDGAEIWIDYARIKPGEGLPDRIGEALEWCDTSGNKSLSRLLVKICC